MAKRTVMRPEVAQPLGPAVRHIPLTQGQVAIVDAADYDRLMQWNWFAHWNPHTRSFYAKRNIVQANGKQTPLGMHADIICPRQGMVADHISGETLDNRRSNLRESSRSENSINRRVFRSNSLGKKGVRHHSYGQFQARIAVGGRKVHLGLYPTAGAAEQAYKEAAKRLHGEFRRMG